MRCPNCKKAQVRDNICPDCGVDAVLFGRTSIISCSLYNKGLAQAKLRDLSGAVANLTKSIEFNKNNILSRNLLGLVYFEAGYIGEALKQWVISQSVVKEDNPASGYLQKLQDNSRSLDMLSDAVSNYNQALEYISQKNDDMAVIQLKKALEINPVFIDALNLLAFCFLIRKDKERAAVLVEKVLALDVHNAIALNYYKEIYPQKVRPAPKKIARLQASYPEEPTSYGRKLFRDSHYMTEVLSFLIGLIAASGLMFFLVVPGHVAAANREIGTLRHNLEEVEGRLAVESEYSSTTIEELRNQVRNLTSENATLAAQAGLRSQFEGVVRATQLRDSGDIAGAANLLRLVGDFSEMPEDLQASAQNLRDELYPQAAQFFFNEASARYSTGQYQTAQGFLEDSVYFGAASLSFYDDVLFYLASIAEMEGRSETARQYFQMILTGFPNSSRLTEAGIRFNNLSAS